MSLAATIARSRARADITRALKTLPNNAWAGVLAEVMDEIGVLPSFVAELAPMFAPSEPARTEGADDAAPLPPVAASKVVSPRVIWHVRTGRPVKADGYKANLLKVLAATPRMPIAELAMRIYGDNSKHSRDRVRSLLSVMNGRQVERVGTGEWQVLKDATEEPATA